MKKSKWKLWLVPLLAVLAFGVYKEGDIWGQKQAPRPVEHVQTVGVKDVATVKIEKVITLTGSLEAAGEAAISARVAGRVSRVLVENGTEVTTGQPLVLLEDTEFANQLAMNQSSLKKAEAGVAAARSNYERFKELYHGGVVSKKDFDEVETGLKMAEADAASAAAAVANAEESLRNATVFSPLNGVVAGRKVNVGQVVSPGVPLMTVMDISYVYAVVNVEQKDLARIKPGLPAAVMVDAYGDRKFGGTVAIINPAANKAARVFETKIRVDNQEGLLKPGMFARVEIGTGEAEEKSAVPQNALIGKQGMFFVFVAEGDVVKRRQVEIGQMIDQLVEIKSGLSLGEKVVVTNVNKLKDQDRIKVAD
ncbi:MAG: efflux RND transporter periplasmic adaptor subunit [Peptococcaceae bacterium]|nr:efflux RND transporter periplasmic adaptor subunit [Peptococcaceae bacterium]